VWAPGVDMGMMGARSGPFIYCPIVLIFFFGVEKVFTLQGLNTYDQTRIRFSQAIKEVFTLNQEEVPDHFWLTLQHESLSGFYN